MRMVVAVVQSQDAHACAAALTAEGFSCTRFDSSGAFLDSRNATLLTGVGDHEVERVLAILREHARRRVEVLEPTLNVPAMMGALIMPPVQVEVGGATVFVLPVERCEKL